MNELQSIIAEMRKADCIACQTGGNVATSYVADWASRLESVARQQASAEPVAWLCDTPAGREFTESESVADGYKAKGYSAQVTPLYTTPPQPVAEPGWRPIETAPKEGRTPIFLLGPSGLPQLSYSNTWWQSGFSVECKPTHWMPLPAPPEPT